METMHQIYYNMFDSAFTAIARTFLSHFPMSLKGCYLGTNNKKGVDFRWHRKNAFINK